MRKVTQTLFGPGNGNCWAACIASVLECDIDKLPNYHNDTWFWDWERFLEPHGLALLGKGSSAYYWNTYWIGIVLSLNNPGKRHAVVMHDATLAHDPNDGAASGGKVYTDVSYKECEDGYCIVLSDAGLYRRSSLYA